MRGKTLVPFFAALVAGGLHCAAPASPGATAPSAPRALADLREEATGGDEGAGRALLGEMLLPGGERQRAASHAVALERSRAEGLYASLARALYAEAHGRPRAAADAYVAMLGHAQRATSDADAPLLAWFAAHRIGRLRGSVAGLLERHRATFDALAAAPGALGWRAVSELVDLSLAASQARAEAEGPAGAARVAARVGCSRAVRLAGPFGPGSAASRRHRYAAERPGPWPPVFAADPLRGTTPRVLRTEQPRCHASSTEDTEPGVFYAETFFTLDRERELIVAAQGALAIFVDDAPVHARDLREWGAWQRFGVRLAVPAGRHRVVVRLLGDNTSIRFLEPDGRPAGVATDAMAHRAYGTTPPRVLTDPNPIDAIVRRRGEADGLRAFFAAYIAHVEAMDDVATTLMEPLVTPDDAAGVALEMAALYARGDGARSDDARRTSERSLRVRAVARDPGLWYSRAWLGIDAGEQRGAVEAVAPLRTLAAEFPEVPDVLEGLTRVYQRLGWRGERLATVRMLAEKFPDDTSGLRLVLEALDEEGPREDADRVASRIASLDPDAEVGVERALQRRDYPAAIAELRRIAARRPDRKELAGRIAAVLEQAGDPRAAAEQLSRALARDRHNAKARFSLADRAFARGDTSALRRALAEALEAGASGTELRDAIALVEGASHLEGYRIDGRAVIAEFERWEKGGKRMEGTAARILDYAALWVHPDGTSEMLEHEIQRIQAQEAVQKEAEQPAPEGLVLRMRVLKKDGRVLEPEAVAGKPTLTMPHLEVGDIVETERILPLNEGDALRYRSPHWFFREAEKGYWRSEFITLTPKGRALEVETRGKVPPPKVTDRGAFVEHRFRVDESPPAPLEPDAPRPVEFLPSVRLGWGISLATALARLEGAASDETPLDPRTAVIARTIVRDVPASDPLEQARRIYRWVVSSVEDGNDSDGRRVVLGRRGSRQAAFMHLVRQLGLSVDLALAKNRLAMPPLGKMSEVENWDTILVRLTVGGAPTWLVVRDKFTPFGFVPAELRGQPAYVLSPGTPLVTLPTAGAPDGVFFEGRAVVREDGSARLELRQRYAGRVATQMRGVVDRIAPGQLRDFVESRLVGRSFSGARVRDVALEDRDDLDKPLTIRTVADVPELVRVAGGRAVVKPIFPLKLVQLATLPARETPLLLGSSSHAAIRVELVLPERWRAPRPTTGEARNGDRVVLVRDQSSEGSVLLDRRVDVPAGRVAPGSDYAALLQFTRDGDALLEREIVLER